MKKLTNDEISQTVNKIKEKYNKVIVEFSKPKALLKSFEDRYINALKEKQDISVFILAEIEAVDEIYSKEIEKRKTDDALKLKNSAETGVRMTIADKVFDENRKKIDKYEKAKISDDADEELERLIGAIRNLMINYWPVINYIFNNSLYSTEKSEFNNYYNKLITLFDFREQAPIAKSYIHALTRVPKDFKRIEQEHKFIFKEAAFLLNEIYSYLTSVLINKTINFEDNKIFTEAKDKLNVFKKFFDGLSYKQCIEKVSDYVFNVINDFRVKDIKRNS